MIVVDPTRECCCDTDFWCRRHYGEPPGPPPVTSHDPPKETSLGVRTAECLLAGLKKR